MKHKRINTKAVILALSLGAMTTACSDWDDHYDEAALSGSANQTLWQNISANENLSDFAALLKKEKYDELLSADQSFTVWAPENGTFNYDSLNQLTDSRLVAQFLNNHIARSSYPASGSISDKIYVLNKKSLEFVGSGSYTINGIAVSTPNVASKNGVMHILGASYIPFKYNIYESLNNETFPIDSLANFYHKYDISKLDEEKSVPGPVYNGEQTYLDSVLYQHNTLFTRYFQYINREDSNYTMIVPTNTAWTAAKNTIKPYFHYLDSFYYFKTIPDNMAPTKLNKPLIDKLATYDYATANITGAYLSDSLTNMFMLSDLAYNNNRFGNAKHAAADSVVSTTGSKVYAQDAAKLFSEGTLVEKSNGKLWVTDNLNMQTWTSWSPTIKVEAEYTGNIGLVYGGIATTYSVTSTTKNPNVAGKVSNNRYLEVEPFSLNPTVCINLPDVRSEEYEVYLVTVPSNILSDAHTPLPYSVQVTIGYNKEDGNLYETRLGASRINSTTEIDTIDLGSFTFPVSYVGLSQSPYMRIVGVVRSTQKNIYDTTLRIDCIILVPKALDTYRKAHPDYKVASDD